MRATTPQPDETSALRITRDVAEFVSLDATLNSDHQRGAIWPSVRSDPRFGELVHTVLEHGSKQYHGMDADNVQGYEDFIEGVSFALEAVRQAILASEADTEITELLENPSEETKNG